MMTTTPAGDDVFPPEQMMTISEAARLYNKARETVRNDIAKGLLRLYANNRGEKYVHSDEVRELYGIRLVIKESTNP